MEPELKVARKALLDAITKATMVSETVILKAYSERLLVRAFSETGDYEKAFHRTDFCILGYTIDSSTKCVKALYGAGFLKDLLNFPCEAVEVEFSTEKPIALKYDGAGYAATAWLAPRVDGKGFEPEVTVRFLEDHVGVYDEDEFLYGAAGFRAGEIAQLPLGGFTFLGLFFTLVSDVFALENDVYVMWCDIPT